MLYERPLRLDLQLNKLESREPRNRHNHCHRHRRHGRAADALSQAMVGEDQHRTDESDHQPFRRLASGFRDSHARGSEIREGLSNSGERLSNPDPYGRKRSRHLSIAIERLARAGEQAGFSVKQMIEILNAGIGLGELLDMISFSSSQKRWNLTQQQ